MKTACLKSHANRQCIWDDEVVMSRSYVRFFPHVRILRADLGRNWAIDISTRPIASSPHDQRRQKPILQHSR